MIGKSVAHYRITAKLGEGGMGEVYRATDSRLHRDVALKMLPEGLAADAQRMGRFQREAEVLASLSHAHIGQIYGIEQAGDTKALVLELIEGPTLAERIAEGPIPWRETLTLALQIAEALEAAHERGIVHRDLKPANIKITPEDQIKVLDFGLAKAMGIEEDAEASELSRSPTLSMGATRAGMILGTAAYMSPEQARGKRVDKRTDIFAFGVVLFEMLTGKKAFRGDDVSLTLAAVMKDEPDDALLPQDAPDPLRRLLKRCLAKSPRDRLRDIGDARYEIQQVLSGEAVAPTPPVASRASAGWAALLTGAGALLGVLVSAAWFSTDRDATPPARMHAELLSPEPLRVSQFTQQIAISPDGSRILFTVEGEEQPLFQRRLDDPEPVPVAGTEGGRQPLISPNGNWLAFHASGALKKVPIDGGVAEVLTEARNTFGSTWPTDDSILFASGPGDALVRVSANGGAPEALKSQPPTMLHRPTSLMPDGKRLLASQWWGGNLYDLVLFDLDTGERRHLIENVGFGRVLPTGHLLFSRSDGLYAVRFDPDSLSVSGPEVPLVRNAFSAEGSNLAQFDVSDNGTLVYIPGRAPRRELVMVDRTGQPAPLPVPTRHYSWPRFSPDGQRVVVTIPGSPTDEAWTVDPDTGTLARITRDAKVARVAAWTADGKNLLYTSVGSAPDQFGVYSRSSDGSGEAEAVLDPGDSRYFDVERVGAGETLFGSLYEGTVREAGTTIFSLDLGGGSEPTLLLPRRADVENYNPAPSPDGRWIAYVSDESGRAEVYLSPIPSTGEKRIVSRNGGSRVVWMGREIFFVSASSTMMVVQVTGPEARLSEPRALFSMEPYWRGDNYTGPNWDVSSDGQHFIMTRFVEEPDTAPPRHLEIITNFFDELREKVP